MVSVSESQQDAAVSGGKVSKGGKLRAGGQRSSASESSQTFPEASAASHRHSVHLKTYSFLPPPPSFYGSHR